MLTRGYGPKAPIPSSGTELSLPDEIESMVGLRAMYCPS